MYVPPAVARLTGYTLTSEPTDTVATACPAAYADLSVAFGTRAPVTESFAVTSSARVRDVALHPVSERQPAREASKLIAVIATNHKWAPVNIEASVTATEKSGTYTMVTRGTNMSQAFGTVPIRGVTKAQAPSRRFAMTRRDEALPPLLHGDGVADDTEAVQWYLDHHVALPIAVVGYRVEMARSRVPDGVALASGRGTEPDAVVRAKLVAP